MKKVPKKFLQSDQGALNIGAKCIKRYERF